jgi:hypothetical protein
MFIAPEVAQLQRIIHFLKLAKIIRIIREIITEKKLLIIMFMLVISVIGMRIF